MKLAAATALLVLGCTSLFGDLDRVIALEIVGGTARTIAVGDSLLLVARPVTAAGDTVPGAEIVWAVLDTGVVGFTLEQHGLVIGTADGEGRVQARYENLRSDTIRSDPIRITVTAPVP